MLRRCYAVIFGARQTRLELAFGMAIMKPFNLQEMSKCRSSGVIDWIAGLGGKL